MFATAIAFVLKNPIARKAALVAALVFALLYINKLSINHAFEQGRQQGAQQAWVEAEKQHSEQFAQFQAQMQKEYDALKVQREEIARERDTFAKAAVVAKAKRDDSNKSVSEQVRTASAAVVSAPVGDDGLPPKDVILNALAVYKEAYEVQVSNYAGLEAEYEETVRLQNKSIYEKEQEITSLTKDLDQTKAQLKFETEAFHGVIKKPHGFWHKVKRIVTIGIAK